MFFLDFTISRHTIHLLTKIKFLQYQMATVHPAGQRFPRPSRKVCAYRYLSADLFILPNTAHRGRATSVQKGTGTFKVSSVARHHRTGVMAKRFLFARRKHRVPTTFVSVHQSESRSGFVLLPRAYEKYLINFGRRG